MNKKLENKQENKKSRGLFIGTMIASLLFGALIGFIISGAGDGWTVQFGDSMAWAAQNVLPWGTVACFVVMLAVYFPLYSDAKKIFAAWDQEDEAVIEKAEHKLEIVFLWQSILQILCFFFMGCCAAYIKETETAYHWVTVLASLVGMIASLVVLPMTQRRVVDLVKEMNPEKKGSVYDLNFSKKWMSSCDEAEKVMIYKSAYYAFRVTTYTCLVLWMILVLTSTFFNANLLALACVSLIWLLNTVTYLVYSIKQGKMPPAAA